MMVRDLTDELKRSAAEYPVLTIMGARQSGKTTLARRVLSDKPWVSLEDTDVRIPAEADLQGFFAQFSDRARLIPLVYAYRRWEWKQ